MIGGGGSFNQHDEPCHPFAHAHTHTHTQPDTDVREWAYAEGQWAGRCAIISPNLHGELLTHVEGASFDLQKAHPHYAEAAVSLAAQLSSGLREGLTKGSAPVHGGGREGRDGQEEKQELVVILIPMRFF